MKKISWKKGPFSSKYRLYDHNEELGDFRQPVFFGSPTGNMDGTRLRFKKKGIFSSETEITDLNSNECIGSVKFNAWGNKAEITLNNKKYDWKYDNFWNTKWSISENQHQLIRYKSSTSRGQIESLTDSRALLLCGLYVHNRYLTLMIIIAVSTAVILSSR